MFALILLTTFIGVFGGHSAAEWKSRTIYQVITDRFARNNGDTSGCWDITKYCGGGWKGLINNLDYIQGLGFDAIWSHPLLRTTVMATTATGLRTSSASTSTSDQSRTSKT